VPYALAWALDIAEESAAGYADGLEALGDAHATAGALMSGDEIEIARASPRSCGCWRWPSASKRDGGRNGPAWSGAWSKSWPSARAASWSMAAAAAPTTTTARRSSANGWRLEWAPRRYLSTVEDAARAVAPIARPLVKPALKAALATYGVPPELVDAGDAAIDAARTGRAPPAAGDDAHDDDRQHQHHQHHQHHQRAAPMSKNGKHDENNDDRRAAATPSATCSASAPSSVQWSASVPTFSATASAIAASRRRRRRRHRRRRSWSRTRPPTTHRARGAGCN
jgi:hypothetical protein